MNERGKDGIEHRTLERKLVITAYCADGVSVPVSPTEAFPEHAAWIDMVEPTRDEELFVERALGVELPTRDELKDIEPSARLYAENNSVFMTASLVSKSQTEVPVLADIGFVLVQERLVTIRYARPKSFALFIAAFHKLPRDWRRGPAILARLLETIIDRTAEILEEAATSLDILSLHVFGDRVKKVRKPSNFLEQKLKDVASHHRLVSKVRDCLSSLSRMVTFLAALPAFHGTREIRDVLKSVSRDIQSLSEHASFVAGNITFLLDASLGLINIEQNAIIKIFSIASVVFLPPTLVASIYGMNFEFMPELHWPGGYPASLGLMVISALIPFLFFRWKGWL